MSADHKARGGMADIDAALAEFERWTTGFDSRSTPEYRHRVLRQDGEAYDVIHYRRTREDAEQACRACAMAAALEAAAQVRAGQDHGGEANEMIGEVERLTRERDEARESNRKLHRDIQQREREFIRATRAEQRRVWLYLGHPWSVSELRRISAPPWWAG